MRNQHKQSQYISRQSFIDSAYIALCAAAPAGATWSDLYTYAEEMWAERARRIAPMSDAARAVAPPTALLDLVLDRIGKGPWRGGGAALWTALRGEPGVTRESVRAACAALLEQGRLLEDAQRQWWPARGVQGERE